MTAHVIFFRPRGIGAIEAPGVGAIRRREAIAVPGTTTDTVREGELVLIANLEAGTVVVAYGPTPDAAALDQTKDTSAGIPVQAGGYSVPLLPTPGSKINIKALA